MLMLSYMAWPLLACFVLVGIHSYLGIHVIARKVIFVDLALAQIAALGTVYGFFLGLSFETDILWVKLISVLFTLLGALLFSFTRTSDEKVPHEAIIGIIYAAALSMTILLTANLPHGSEEVRQILAGNILWVTPKEVIFTAILYSAVGLIHIIFRKQFFILSQEISLADKAKINVRFWDFLFYATFGVVVTSSVSMGGVLLVFGYLVIPSVIAIMLATTTKSRLIIGWLIGGLISVVGVVVSYYLDLPSGPTIVVLMALCLAMIAMIKNLKPAYLFLIIVVPLFLFFLTKVINFDHEHEQEPLSHLLIHEGRLSTDDFIRIKNSFSSNNEDDIVNSLKLIDKFNLQSLALEVTTSLLSDSDSIRELSVQVLRGLKSKSSTLALREAYKNEQDSFIKIEIADTLLSLQDKFGFNIFKQILIDEDSLLIIEDVFYHIRQWLSNVPSSKKDLILFIEKNYHLFKFKDGMYYN